MNVIKKLKNSKSIIILISILQRKFLTVLTLVVQEKIKNLMN